MEDIHVTVRPTLQLKEPLCGLIGFLHEIVDVGDLEHDRRRPAQNRVKLVEAIKSVVKETKLLVDQPEIVESLHVGGLVGKSLAEKFLRFFIIA